ncbi:fumarate reductase subunit A [Betaproteobacteria bacterium]|nr:fumarate reductase subunit A [Betaproteobacteria bacterium]
MEINTGVLIIGGGGAACRAAIAAADCGAQVLLMSKKPLKKGGATCYPVAEMAGFNAGNPAIAGDTEKHYNDIVSAGQGMASPELAAILAAGAPQAVTTLESWGVRFEEVSGAASSVNSKPYYIFRSCFSRHPRTHVIQGHGEPIVSAMRRQISLRPQIRLMEDITITGLLVTEGVCVGAYGWTTGGEEILVRAGAVILTTGGVCRAFEKNLNPADVTGDGYALAWNAGAELVNMEFMQIGMGFSHPIVNMFNAYLWEGRPVLRNVQDEDFLGKDLPSGLTADDVMHEHRKHFPFSSSDNAKYLEIAVQREIAEGGSTPRGGVKVDLRHMTDPYVASLKDDCGIHHMWPIAREYMKKRGVDLLSQTVEVCCFAHAINGGVKIDRVSSSSLVGLYAAGETAGGPHGADRLGGNMMVTCQVFGAIAGENAALWAMRNPVRDVSSSTSRRWKEEIAQSRDLLKRNAGAEFLVDKLRKTTQRNLLVCRTEAGLRHTLETVGTLEKEIMASPCTDALNLRNFELMSMLSSVRLMAFAALRRKESRGSHHRKDFPCKDENHNSPCVLKKGDTAN